jgi:hypothetical protein
LPDRQHFRLALDGRKKPVDSLASNIGHLPWSGIVDDDTLLRPESAVTAAVGAETWRREGEKRRNGMAAIAPEPTASREGMRGLKGKNILVTGGTSGIGQAIAVRFAEYGANVAINYRARTEEAEDTAGKVHACLAQVRQSGVRDVLVQGDVSREEDVVAMFEDTVERLGGLDILVNNAGIQVSRPSHELPPRTSTR